MNPQQMQQQAAQQQGGIDPNALAEAMATAFAKAAPQQAPQMQQQPLTQEEIDRQLRVFRVGQDHYEQLFGDNASMESRMATLNAIVSGAVNQAITAAQLLSEGMVNDYHGRVLPYLEDARHISQERFYSGMFEQFPGLKPYDAMVKQFMPQLEQMPDFPRERDGRVKFVADKFSSILKQSQPDFDPARGPAPQQPQRGGGMQPQHTQQQVSSQQPAQSTPPPMAHGQSGGMAPSGAGQTPAKPSMGFALPFANR